MYRRSQSSHRHTLYIIGTVHSDSYGLYSCILNAILLSHEGWVATEALVEVTEQLLKRLLVHAYIQQLIM